jgi:hypothetical protein
MIASLEKTPGVAPGLEFAVEPVFALPLAEAGAFGPVAGVLESEAVDPLPAGKTSAASISLPRYRGIPRVVR